MAQNRRDVLAQLKTVLEEVTEVKTVVRHHGELDITQYSQADLPLIGMQEPAEGTEEEMTSMHSVANLDVVLKVWFLCWGINPTTTYGALMKMIRNKLGANFTVGERAVKVLVGGISKIEGEMPLFWFNITLDIQYYLNQMET